MRRIIPTLIFLFAMMAVAFGQSTPGTVRFPTNLDDNDSLIRTTDAARTTLSTTMTTGSSTITVASTSLFSATGTIVIDSEIIIYKVKTGTTFTTLTRGADGTTVAAHTSGVSVRSPILSFHKRTTDDALIATQTKIGSGVSTPIVGKVLWGNGTGTSTWSASPQVTRIDFDTTNVSAPSASVNTTGTRLLLYPSPAPDHYGIGVETSYVWLNAPVAGGFRFYFSASAAERQTFSSSAHTIESASDTYTIDFQTSNGAPAALRLNTNATKLQMSVGGNIQWEFGTNALLPFTDNTESIGSTSVRVKELFLNRALGVSLVDGSGNKITHTAGTGSPEGVVTARIGSTFSRDDGSTGTTYYIKEANNTTNLGWVAVAAGGGGSPGGSDTQLQRNNAGAFGGISGATTNGTDVTFGSANLIATRPKFIASLDDTNGNEIFKIGATASAVNEFTFTNAATGNSPILAATGETNVGLVIQAKGTGSQKFQRSDATLVMEIDRGNSGRIEGLQFTSINPAFTLTGAMNAAGLLTIETGSGISWSSDATWYGTTDVGIKRNAAGIIEVNNGTAGVLGGLKTKTLELTGADGTQYLNIHDGYGVVEVQFGRINAPSGSSIFGGIFLSSSADTAIARNAAGVVEINNTTLGAFRDLKLRNLEATGNVGIGTVSSATTKLSAQASGTDDIQRWMKSDGSLFAQLDGFGRLYLNPGLVSGFGPATVDAAFAMTPRTTGAPGMIVRGLASQTASLTSWQDSAATVVASVGPTGDILFRHLIGGGSAPSVVVGGATIAGTGATASVSGTDSGFVITFDSGTGTSAIGTVFTVTFATAYGTAPVAIISANGANAADAFINGFYSDATTSTIVFTTTSIMTASQTYKWNVVVTGR